MQLYADLRILSARPPWHDCLLARHRLYGILDYRQRCSAMQWRALAQKEVQHAHEDRRVPIIVGGPGLYLKAFFGSLAPIPPIDPTIRRRIRALEIAEAYRQLQHCDPPMAERLHPHDGQRILRALEVFESTKQSLSDWQQRFPYDRLPDNSEERPFLIVIQSEREELARNVRQRFSMMIHQGAIQEVEQLRHRPDISTSAVLTAYGVREIIDHLEGRCTLAEAVERSCRQTDRFIRRQIGWLRRHFPTPDFTFSKLMDAAPNIAPLLRALDARKPPRDNDRIPPRDNDGKPPRDG